VTELVVDPRFNGPPGSANGGYTCGLLAEAVGAPVEVTLRRPPPLARPLDVVRADGTVRLLDGETLVAEAVPGEVDLDSPPAVGLDEAERAAARYPGFERHAFPTCFVCGPDRREGDGLRIFAGPVPGRDVFAAPWVAPDDVSPPVVWAALDCPGAIAVGFPDRGETLLGRFAVRIDRIPNRGEECVVVAWPLGEDGRKLYAGTALFSAAGEPLAVARATWIEPRSATAGA
jgi:hypothetical protein